ncbi:MAG TPA: hypothetical protein VFR86_30035 [Burkholderiaceae bacterium]|nr:hypothetical protein [Burkholderiaceae bacterium]
MSSSSSPFGPDASVPPTREFTAAWIAYALFAAGIFFAWPALLGVIVAYSKRGTPAAGFIDSHHRWMIGTFWWALFASVICIGIVIAGVWPLASDVVRAVIAQGGDWRDEMHVNFRVNWQAVFSTVGGAILGLLGLLAAWIWYVYRVVRGMLALHDARVVP